MVFWVWTGVGSDHDQDLEWSVVDICSLNVTPITYFAQHSAQDPQLTYGIKVAVKKCEKPDPESLFIFGRSRSLCGLYKCHGLSKNIPATSFATSDVFTSDVMFSEKILMSDVLVTNLMLIELSIVFPTFSILSGWKRIRFNSWFLSFSHEFHTVLSLLGILTLDWNFRPFLGIFGKAWKCVKWTISAYLGNHTVFHSIFNIYHSNSILCCTTGVGVGVQSTQEF